MTDAYDTLREMLANVPDDAQVYVEELESIVEWPGITAGTFRALLAEIAGFEWGWEQREKAHDAEVATLTAQLATAKREGFVNGAAWGAKNYLFSATHQAVLANEQAFREYPATPSGEGHRCKPEDGCEVCNILRNATPSPEAREVPSEVVVRVETRRGIGWYSNGETIVCITPADAKRIVAMGTA
jgi:hypothetical protein